MPNEYLVSHITAESMADLQSFLEQHPKQEVVIRIQSSGGDVLPAISGHNALRRFASQGGTVNTIADGQSASASTLLLSAASPGKARAVSTSTLMMHTPWVQAQGNEYQLASAVSALQATGAAMREVYSARIKDEAALDTAMSGTDAWMTPEAAKSIGLIDEIVQPGDLQANAFSVGQGTGGFTLPPPGPNGSQAAPSIQALPATPAIGYRTNSHDGRIKAAAEAIAAKGGFGKTDNNNFFRGLRMDEMPKAIQAATGGPFPQHSDTLPHILSEASTIVIGQAFRQAPEVWPRICRNIQVRNFKDVSLASLGIFPAAKRIIGESSEIEFVPPLRDAGQQGSLHTFASRYAISRRSIIDDDAGALTNIAFQLGASCSRSVGDQLAETVQHGNTMDGNTPRAGHGVTLSDGRALFGTGDPRNNSINTAISSVGVQALYGKMALAADPSGLVSGIVPNALWVGQTVLPYVNSLLTAEHQVAERSETPRAATSQPNEAKGLFDTDMVFADWRLDVARPQSAWYMLKAGQDTSAFVVLTLEGAPEPMVQDAPLMNRDGFEFRVIWDARVLPVSYTLIGRGGV